MGGIYQAEGGGFVFSEPWPIVVVSARIRWTGGGLESRLYRVLVGDKGLEG